MAKPTKKKEGGWGMWEIEKERSLCKYFSVKKADAASNTAITRNKAMLA